MKAVISQSDKNLLGKKTMGNGHFLSKCFKTYAYVVECNICTQMYT